MTPVKCNTPAKPLLLNERAVASWLILPLITISPWMLKGAFPIRLMEQLNMLSTAPLDWLAPPVLRLRMLPVPILREAAAALLGTRISIPRQVMFAPSVRAILFAAEIGLACHEIVSATVGAVPALQSAARFRVVVLVLTIVAACAVFDKLTASPARATKRWGA